MADKRTFTGSPADLIKACNTYIAKAATGDVKCPNKAGFALELGYAEWACLRELADRNTEFVPAVKECESLLTNWMLGRAMDVSIKGNPAQISMLIFILKCAYGWREDDKGDITRTIPEMIQQIGAVVMQYVDKAKAPEAVAKVQEIASKAISSVRG